MGYFAKINKRNNVTEVIAAEQSIVDSREGTWVETKMDGSIRKNYAGIGYSYDESKDAFIPPKPFDSWVLNDGTCQWDAPVTYPDDGEDYKWDEIKVNWVKVDGS
jgi:hypothetical protein